MDSPGEKSPAVSRRTVMIRWIACVCLCALGATLALVLSKQAEHGYFIIVSAYALVVVAALSDAALRKVPNRLTYPAVLLALAINALAAPLLAALAFEKALVWLGTPGWRESLLGLGLCVVIGVVSFAARGLGGGDVKLLFALGALVGLDAVVPILINTLAVAAVVGILNLAVRGGLMKWVQILFLRVYELAITRRFASPATFSRTEGPFCLSLLIGMALVPFFNLHAIVMGYLRTI